MIQPENQHPNDEGNNGGDLPTRQSAHPVLTPLENNVRNPPVDYLQQAPSLRLNEILPEGDDDFDFILVQLEQEVEQLLKISDHTTVGDNSSDAIMEPTDGSHGDPLQTVPDSQDDKMHTVNELEANGDPLTTSSQYMDVIKAVDVLPPQCLNDTLQGNNYNKDTNEDCTSYGYPSPILPSNSSDNNTEMRRVDDSDANGSTCNQAVIYQYPSLDDDSDSKIHVDPINTDDQDNGVDMHDVIEPAPTSNDTDDDHLNTTNDSTYIEDIIQDPPPAPILEEYTSISSQQLITQDVDDDRQQQQQQQQDGEDDQIQEQEEDRCYDESYDLVDDDDYDDARNNPTIDTLGDLEVTEDVLIQHQDDDDDHGHSNTDKENEQPSIPHGDIDDDHQLGVSADASTTNPSPIEPVPPLVVIDNTKDIQKLIRSKIDEVLTTTRPIGVSKTRDEQVIFVKPHVGETTDDTTSSQQQNVIHEHHYHYTINCTYIIQPVIVKDVTAANEDEQLNRFADESNPTSSEATTHSPVSPVNGKDGETSEVVEVVSTPPSNDDTHKDNPDTILDGIFGLPDTPDGPVERQHRFWFRRNQGSSGHRPRRWVDRLRGDHQDDDRSYKGCNGADINRRARSGDPDLQSAWDSIRRRNIRRIKNDKHISTRELYEARMAELKMETNPKPSADQHDNHEYRPQSSTRVVSFSSTPTFAPDVEGDMHTSDEDPENTKRQQRQHQRRNFRWIGSRLA